MSTLFFPPNPNEGDTFTGENGVVYTYVNGNYPNGIWQGATGNLLNVTTDVIPSSNISQSLGNATNQWQDLWVSGNTIYIGSVPLTIDNGTLQVDGANVVTGNGGGNASTGNIAFSGTTMSGPSGAVDGYSVYIQPSADFTNTLQILPTADNDIHLFEKSGNAITLGSYGESQLTVNGPGSANANITVQSAGNTWTFGQDGVLTLPNADASGFGNIYFEENSSTITFGLDDNSTPSLYSFSPYGMTIPSNIDLPLVAKLNSGGVGNTNAAEFGTQVTSNGTTITSSQIYMGAGTTEVRGIVDNNGAGLMYAGVEGEGFAGIVGMDPNVTSQYAIAVGPGNTILLGATTGNGNLTTTEYTAGVGALNANGTINGLLASSSNVVISNGNTAGWSFGDTGNLTLPSNIASINYANGQPYGGTGSSAAAGNAGDIQINVAGNIGADPTLRYVDNGGEMTLYADYLNAPGVFTSDIYAGDGTPSNITLTTSYGNATWNFGSDGNTLFPGNLGFQGTWINNTAGGELYISPQDGNVLLALPGDTDSATVPVRLANFGNGTVQILSGPPENQPWTFGSDGNLTTPGNINFTNNAAIQLNPVTGVTIYGNSVDQATALMLNDAGDAALYANANVTINSNSQGSNPQWIFDTDGNLTIPGAIRTVSNSQLELTESANTAYLGTTADDSTALYLTATTAQLYANGEVSISSNVGGGNAYGWAFDVDGNTNIPGDIISFGNIGITTNVGNTTQSWTFDDTGNLTLPVGTPSINYANGQPYGGTGGSANIIYNGLSNVSVPAANGSVVINTQNPNINVNAILNASYGLSAGTYINQPTTALTGVGIGMTVNYTVLVGNDVIDSVSIYTPGTGYASGDQVTIPVGVPVSGAIFDITVGAPDTETWTFSQTGELLTPQGGRLGYAGKGWLGLDGGYGAPVSVTSYYANGFYAGCVSAYPDGNVGVTTYTGSENYSWNFDNTGALNLPIINNGPFGGFSGAIQTASAYPTLLAYGLGGHGGPELDWIDSDDPANTFSNSNTVRNTLYLNGNAGLYVGFNENGNTGPYTGHFQVDTLGNVQIPSQNVGNSTANGTPGEATYLRGTRKVINGVYTGAQNPFAVEIAAGPASTVAYTATNQSVQSVRVTFAVQSTGNGSCWEQFDVVATPSQDTPGTVNYVVSNRIKSTSTVTDTQVTATLNGANQIEISLVPMTGQNGWASFDAVEFGLMVD